MGRNRKVGLDWWPRDIGLFTEAATAAADKKPARASASKPSSDVGSDDAAFDVLMRIFDKDNR